MAMMTRGIPPHFGKCLANDPGSTVARLGMEIRIDLDDVLVDDYDAHELRVSRGAKI
jgi:hypothetical protein